MRLTLLCHAATAATRAASFPGDEPIEPAAAARLARHPPRLLRHDRCLVSPARRAVETAAALGLTATVEPALREIDYGRWTGRPLAGLRDEDPAGVQAWLSDPGAAPHGGESLADLLARVGAWLRQQAALTGSALAVTHASVIRAAIVHALAAPPEAFWRIDVLPLAVATLGGEGGRLTVRGLLSPREAM